MQVEIWSDIMCPFCFIGKHKFEAALEKMPFKDKIEVHWKSFQLNPWLQVEKGVDVFDFLAQEKGKTREWAIQMHEQVAEMGLQAGVKFNFEKVIPVNTFDAHRIIQLAKSVGKGTEAEEKMFQAFFVEGRDLSDVETLKQCGLELGLPKEALLTLLETDNFSAEVERDMYEAKQISVRGVPYFVFNDRYAVSGAQEEATFMGVLEKSFQEWLQNNPTDDLQIIEGKVCRIDGTCD